jgi:hypothetical protein
MGSSRGAIDGRGSLPTPPEGQHSAGWCALLALMVAACGDVGSAGRARGYAEAMGYTNVIARATAGDTDIDSRVCGGAGAYVYVFGSDQGAGLICSDSTKSWLAKAAGSAEGVAAQVEGRAPGGTKPSPSTPNTREGESA